MKIWLEISNSPHINLFSGMINDLGRAHEVVVTARPLANTIDLLKLHGIAHTVVGKHYGAGGFAKFYGYPVRVGQLWHFLKDKKIDAAISQSSFHSPVVARLLGVRSIYMNDNEHALGNVPAFVAASTILVPECLSEESLRRQFASRRKLRRYPGVKEGIYLHRGRRARHWRNRPGLRPLHRRGRHDDARDGGARHPDDLGLPGKTPRRRPLPHGARGLRPSSGAHRGRGAAAPRAR